MRAHFLRFARYNAWANSRLYGAAALLSEAQRQEDVGAYFSSLNGTLNHILNADRIWLRRLTGEGPNPAGLDEIAHPDFTDLRAARLVEDARIADYVEGFQDADFEAEIEYRNLAGAGHVLTRGAILAHLFNHQTHHRGQAHHILSQLGQEPPELDLLYFMLPDA